MENPERWKEVFRSKECRKLLEENLDAFLCAHYFRILNVISCSDLVLVERCVTSKEKCVKLLDLLLTRESCWRDLMDYLKESNQRSVVRALERLYQNKLDRDNRIIYYRTLEGWLIPKLWNVPARNPHFTGRDQELEQLAFSFNPPEPNVTVVSACQDLGGVGKTQLAIEFVHHHKYYYPYIFWFMAGDSRQIEKDYLQLAYHLKIDMNQPMDSIVTEVKAWLDRHGGGLLVYDNASNFQEIRDYLPTTGTNSILVTSRTTQWDGLGRITTVDVFTIDEAKAYLQELLGSLFKLEEDEALGILAKTLGCLPSALAQAGTYMKKNKVYPSRYLVIKKLSCCE